MDFDSSSDNSLIFTIEQINAYSTLLNINHTKTCNVQFQPSFSQYLDPTSTHLLLICQFQFARFCTSWALFLLACHIWDAWDCQKGSMLFSFSIKIQKRGVLSPLLTFIILVQLCTLSRFKEKSPIYLCMWVKFCSNYE